MPRPIDFDEQLDVFKGLPSLIRENVETLTH